jgi:ADP-heptose:LPS heptosyltransferase
MNKNFKIFAGRGSLIGDTIMFLPALTILEKLFPDSYKIFPISQKTAYSSVFFLNHPLIDKIHITEGYEALGQNDVEIIKNCKAFIHPFPQHPPCPGLSVGIDNFWYNEYDCVEETTRMANISKNQFDLLSEEEKKPKLSKWFSTERKSKSIAIHARAGYNNEPKRNPSTKYWREVTQKIITKGYKVYHCGVESEEDIGEGVIRITHLSLFEQIKVCLGCDLVIGNNSGFNWIIGAYGHPMISLLCCDAPKHEKNLLAFAPKNYRNNNINLLNKEACDLIQHDEIIEAIEKICN